MQTVPIRRVGTLERTASAVPRAAFPVVVRAPRELDMASGPQLVTTVARVVALPPVPDVHLLVGGVDFIDVAGVRALIECRELVRDRSGELFFVDRCTPLDRVLDLVPELRRKLEVDR
jgi:anti-anti-sigma factor